MNNQITEKYFAASDLAQREKGILSEIKKETGFAVESKIYTGKIYDKDKVWSLIYRGSWREQPAILKIQGLKPEIDEIDIINRFNRQNKSKIVRLPRLFAGLKWNIKKGYGYQISEHIHAPMIYQPPFTSQQETDDFCYFYQEYKTKCLNQPLFPPTANEQSSLVFTAQRVSHWSKIAAAKKSSTKEKINILEKYFSLAAKHLPSIKMAFMHGHLTYWDIFKVSGKEYVLMSNLFWSWRPEYYDTAFHLWAGIKSIRDSSISSDQVIKYLDNWVARYKQLAVIKDDYDFERKFAIMILERCVGALLVDVENQDYTKNKRAAVQHLTKLFCTIFEHFANKL